MRHVAVDEGRVLHGHEEAPQPAQRRAVESGVELVPEDEWQMLLEDRVAHDVEGGRETVLAGQLREVELEHAQPAGQQRRGDLLDGERLAGAGRAEHGHRERPLDATTGAEGLDVVGHDGPHAAQVLDLGAVDRRPGADGLDGHAAEPLGALVGRPAGGPLQLVAPQQLDQDAAGRELFPREAHAGELVAALVDRANDPVVGETHQLLARLAGGVEAQVLQVSHGIEAAPHGGGRAVAEQAAAHQSREHHLLVAGHKSRAGTLRIAGLEARVEDQRARRVALDHDGARQSQRDHDDAGGRQW